MTSNIPVSFDAHSETLALAKEQMGWLHSLFSAIKNDQHGHHANNLTALGCFLTDMWSDSYSVMREGLEKNT